MSEMPPKLFENEFGAFRSSHEKVYLQGDSRVTVPFAFDLV
jgi:hypothetical protein